MASLCQDCTACCTVFEVKEIHKHFHEKCKHLGPTPFGPGCTIYEQRPVPCQHYICLWLDSQRRVDVATMPPELRPNACKVVMGNYAVTQDAKTLSVYPLPGYPDAWKYPPVSNHLKMILSRGGKLLIYNTKDQITAIKGDMAIIGTEEEFERILS